MKKYILLLLLIIVQTTIATSYKSLSGSEKRDFSKAYRAVKDAYSETNYEPILKFAPDILSQYESIMIDPDCKHLRKNYTEINKILEKVKGLKTIDSIDLVLESYRAVDDSKNMLSVIDNTISFVLDVDTTKYWYYKIAYDSLVRNILEESSMNAYAFIASLKHADHHQLENFQATIQDKFDNKIAQLSATLNPDSLKMFQLTYPGVRADDIAALLDRSRLAMRQSLLRHPSLTEYMNFRTVFGDDDLLKKKLRDNAFKKALRPPDPSVIKEYLKAFPEEEQTIWTSFEDSLYGIWNKSRDWESAQNYLKLYPEGRYADMMSPNQYQPLVPYTGMMTDEY